MKHFTPQNIFFFVLALPSLAAAVVQAIVQITMVIFATRFPSLMRFPNQTSTNAGIFFFVVLALTTLMQLFIAYLIVRKHKISWFVVSIVLAFVAYFCWGFSLIVFPVPNFTFATTCQKVVTDPFNLEHMKVLNGYCAPATKDKDWPRLGCGDTDINLHKDVVIWSSSKDEPQLNCELKMKNDRIDSAELHSYFD